MSTVDKTKLDSLLDEFNHVTPLAVKTADSIKSTTDDWEVPSSTEVVEVTVAGKLTNSESSDLDVVDVTNDSDVETDDNVVDDGIDSDADDTTKLGFTYVVQRGFTLEGTVYRVGDVIPVKCKFCALWKRKYGGIVRCYPDKQYSDGVVMHEDKFSCESHFICRELEPELHVLLRMSYAEAAAARRMLIGYRLVTDAASWLDGQFLQLSHAKKIEIFKTSKGFITSFTSTEQLDFLKRFLRQYVGLLRKRDQRRNKPKRLIVKPGNWVEWCEPIENRFVRGIVLSIFRGDIRLLGMGAYVDGKKFVYHMREWRETCSPKLINNTDVKI